MEADLSIAASVPTATVNEMTTIAVLCPGQGAQTVGMGRAWADASDEARRTFDEADRILQGMLGLASEPLDQSLSELCFQGPVDLLNRTDISQPALYTCGIACYRALCEKNDDMTLAAAAGLSLGEYTALHLAGAFDFETGLKLVAQRGTFMQEAAEASEGGMVALIGGTEEQAAKICDLASDRSGAILVCANFNAPGQIVLSGATEACQVALEIAAEAAMRATALTVAGAFHSPLMQPAADRMAEVLDAAQIAETAIPVWSNVTAGPHINGNLELLRSRLVEQIVSPVRWESSCRSLVRQVQADLWELAPGSVLRGLMRRIDRDARVQSHDQP